MHAYKQPYSITFYKIDEMYVQTQYILNKHIFWVDPRYLENIQV